MDLLFLVRHSFLMVRLGLVRRRDRQFRRDLRYLLGHSFHLVRWHRWLHLHQPFRMDRRYLEHPMCRLDR